MGAVKVCTCRAMRADFIAPSCTVIPDTETARINDFAVIYDTENRIIGNGEKWTEAQ